MSIKSLTLGWSIAVILLAVLNWSQQADTTHQQVERTTSGLPPRG